MKAWTFALAVLVAATLLSACSDPALDDWRSGPVSTPHHKDYPYGLPVPGRPGFVQSPYAPDSRPVDARRFKPGQQVHCPYTNKIFLVP